MQHRSVGGVPETEQTAVAVIPRREPSAQWVVIRHTPAASRRIPSLKDSRSVGMLELPVAKSPASVSPIGAAANAGPDLLSASYGTNRAAKGLRIVVAYLLATCIAELWRTIGFPAYRGPIAACAAGFALWACVSESGGTRRESCVDLAILCAAAATGAAGFAVLSMPSPPASTHVGAEWILITGAFLVGYLKGFGILGAAIGSQIFIGQLLAYGAKAGPADLASIGCAGLIATVAAVVPRLLASAWRQRSAPSVIAAAAGGPRVPEEPGLLMGIQTASPLRCACTS
jgi:hypothetical protein